MDIRNFLLVFSVIITFFVAQSSGVGGVHHKCIHDQIAEKHPCEYIPHLGRDSHENFRERRQAGDYSPYRMVVYLVVENISNSSTVIPMLTDPSGGFQLAINYLQSVLSVIRAPHNLTIPPSCAARNDVGQCTSIKPTMCGDFATVPDEHLGTIMVCDPTCHEEGGSNIGVDADYILYVSAFDAAYCDGGTLALATFCAADDVNFRSLAGFTHICPLGLEYASSTPQGFFMLMLHEILHAVGFSASDFDFFIDENGDRYSALTVLTINGEDVLAVNSSKVLSYGREYYSCPNLQGVLLENEGGAGSAYSHWEVRTLGYEIMNAAVQNDDYASISNFTLNILEDSGWYKVDYATAKLLHDYEPLWGKGLGCSFITADCDTWPYQCSPPDVSGCSYDYQAMATCVTSDSDSYYDGCSYFRPPFINGFCNSPGAQITNSCFPLMYSNGDLDGRCYGHQCYQYSGAQEPFYTVTRSGSTQLCPYDGATLTFDGTVLTCPPAELTCSRNTPIIPLDSTNVPSSLCHSSCNSCSRPANPAYCLTCSNSLTLRGAAPSVCTADTCSKGTFQNSSGDCVACAAGCRACTGPNNSDCLACEDETFYRVTTDQSSSSACITAAECTTPVVNAFGDRTCDMIMISPTSIMISPTSIMISPTSKMISPTSTVISPTSKMIIPTNQGGGASSIHYHQFLLLFLLVVYSLYL